MNTEIIKAEDALICELVACLLTASPTPMADDCWLLEQRGGRIDLASKQSLIKPACSVFKLGQWKF